MAERWTWTNQQVADFIDIVRECKLVQESDSTRCRNAVIYTAMRERMIKRGHDLTIDQLRRKWKSLKETYNKISCSLNRSGNSSKGLTWVYYHAMHDILGGRPRSLSFMDGHGIESQMPSTLQTNFNDDAPSLTLRDQDDNEAQVLVDILLEDNDDNSDVTTQPETDSDTSSNSQRFIHGQSTSARRRRARTLPYQRDDEVQSLMECFRGVSEQQLQFLKESEERYIQQNERADSMISSTLQTLSNVAVALLSCVRDIDGTREAETA